MIITENSVRAINTALLQIQKEKDELDQKIKALQALVSGSGGEGIAYTFNTPLSCSDSNVVSLDTSGVWTGSAAKAGADANGNSIVSTYATKTECNAKSTVSVTQTQTGGNEVGKVSVDGSEVTLYSKKEIDDTATSATDTTLSASKIAETITDNLSTCLVKYGTAYAAQGKNAGITLKSNGAYLVIARQWNTASSMSAFLIFSTSGNNVTTLSKTSTLAINLNNNLFIVNSTSGAVGLIAYELNIPSS